MQINPDKLAHEMEKDGYYSETIQEVKEAVKHWNNKKEIDSWKIDKPLFSQEIGAKIK